MNINSIDTSYFSRINRNKHNKKQNETALNFEHENKIMGASSFDRDDILAQFWGMTDKMPKKDQISLAASAIVSKVFSNGITTENKSFIKNIKNRFSPEEIGELKAEIKKHPLLKNKSGNEVSNFLKDIDQILNEKNSEIGALQEQNPINAPQEIKDIFFKTTFNFKRAANSLYAI